jgi:hypothetical protein
VQFGPNNITIGAARIFSSGGVVAASNYAYKFVFNPYPANMENRVSL